MAESGYLTGIAGCGRIGSLYDEQGNGSGVYTHAGMYAATDGLRLACLSDPDSTRLAESGRYWGCAELFPDVATMLAQCPVDILSVTTPDQTHETVIRSALGAARPPRIILVEKPLAENAAAAEALLQDATAAGVTLLVNYVRRWDRMHRKVREFLRSGGLGEIRWVTGYYVRGMRHNGCHLVNLMRFMVGDMERLEPLGARETGSLPGDSSVHARVVFSSGAEGVLVALDQPGYAFSIFDLDFFGTKGRLRLTADGSRAEIHPVRKDPRFPGFNTLNPEPTVLASTYETAMLEAGKGLLGMLNNPEERRDNDGTEAVKDLAIIEHLLKMWPTI